uniref:Uncharacterized protein n=1 Tax=Ascaris lumbricoides TaxID=6252 RepID=A0A0M3I3J0_ASCLU
MERTYVEERNQPVFDGDRTMNPLQRIANATHQRHADSVCMVGSEPIIQRMHAARLNGGMAPCIAWQRNDVMNLPNWRPQPYTRNELILLKALKGSLFGYIIVSLLNSLATGSDLMVIYLLLPCITGLFTMYALVSEQFVHLIPFLLALSLSILETLATSFVTLQIRFVTPSDYSLLTRFILQRLPGLFIFVHIVKLAKHIVIWLCPNLRCVILSVFPDVSPHPSLSILETLATSFVTLQIRFVTPSDYSLLTRFILQRLPGLFIFVHIVKLAKHTVIWLCPNLRCVILSVFPDVSPHPALQLEADRRARIERLNQHFLNVAMAADDVVGGLPVADIAFADQGIIGPINDDNPPSYKRANDCGPDLLRHEVLGNMYPCFQTAIKSLTDEESPPRYSLFKHDKRFAQFHSNSDSTSPTINHSQSPPSYGVHVIAQPAPVSTPLGKTYFINLIFLIFIISAHYSNIRRRFLF